MNNFAAFFNKNKPGLLVGLGIGNMLGAIYLTSKCAPVAKERLDRLKKEQGVNKLAPIDVIKTAGPCYIPVILCATFGVSFIICGDHMNVTKGAAAMAAYTLSETALREYREQTKQLVGEKKEKDIRESVAKELVKNENTNDKSIIITGNGEVLCKDAISGRYFKSDIEKLRRIENLLDRRMIDQMFVSLNELYLEIGIPPVALGDELGWHLGKGYIQMDFSAQLTEDGKPCLVMSCSNPQPKNY